MMELQIWFFFSTCLVLCSSTYVVDFKAEYENVQGELNLVDAKNHTSFLIMKIINEKKNTYAERKRADFERDRAKSAEMEREKYVGITSAVFARGILEDFMKTYLTSYIQDNTANGIEAGYIKFLADTGNNNSVRMNSVIANRLTPEALANNCKTAFSKLSKIVHTASQAYRNLHASSMFANILLQIPKLSENEKISIEILSELL